MKSKLSPESLSAAKPAQSPAAVPKAAVHSPTEAPTGEAGEYPFVRGRSLTNAKNVNFEHLRCSKYPGDSYQISNYEINRYL